MTTQMKKVALLFSLAAFVGACGGTQATGAKTAGSVDDDKVAGGDGESGGSSSGGGASAAGDVLTTSTPKQPSRQLSESQRADFQSAVSKYELAKKQGSLQQDCQSVANAFRKIADDNPGIPEARFNQAAVLAECGMEDEAARIWRAQGEGAHRYGPAMASLGTIAYRQGNATQAQSYFEQAIKMDPLHSVEARNNLAQILRDQARRTSNDTEKKRLVQEAVSHLRNALALDSNNLQAFATLTFIYYEMNLLEMAKLVGNQAIKKAEEIATGKFDEEKEDEGGAKGAKPRRGKKAAKEGEEGKGKEAAAGDAGTGYTSTMKNALALVYNTLGLIDLRKRNVSAAIKSFKGAVESNPKLAEARMNLAALSLNNRDYKTAEENLRAVLQMQPKNFEASLGLGVALRGQKKIAEAEAQYNEAMKMDPSNPGPYFNLGLLYQDYKGMGDEAALRKAQDYYRQYIGHAKEGSGDLRKDAEKRIKDIDETFVALKEAAKMQAEAEEMQRKAEAQQKEMEEKMKQQEAAEKAAAEKAAADAKAGNKPADAKAADGKAADPKAAATPAATPTPDPAADDAAKGGKKGKKGKKGK